MPITCCGQPRDTTYCPDCGQKIIKNQELQDLVRHCRNVANVQKKAAENCRDPNQRYRRGSDAAELAKEVASHERSAAKYTAWADAVEALLSGPAAQTGSGD